MRCGVKETHLMYMTSLIIFSVVLLVYSVFFIFVYDFCFLFTNGGPSKSLIQTVKLKLKATDCESAMPELQEEKESIDEDKVTAFKRICMKLQSDDRKVRKNTYIDLEKYLANKDTEFSNDELRVIFCETHMYFLNGLRDKTEAVRDQAICFINYLIIDKLPLNDFYLTYIFPVLVERIGSVEIIEESEEIRLHLLQLIHAIILKYFNTLQLKPFLSDCILILSQTVKDKYPAIKELSCRVVIDLAKALPRDFHMEAELLIKPVLTCFVHQRYKVRLEAINAVGEIIMHSTYKGLNEVVVPLAEKLFDQIPIVRRTVAKIAARWLLEYRDRYSFFHTILPLLLTGLNDEIMETRMEAEALWEKVGLQYEKENEKDLKDEMDYLYEAPKYYPVNLKRPNLGCRTLVKRNVSKLAGPISRELTGWQEDIRVRCSQLLCIIVLHAEDGLAQSLQDLLPAMHSAARDDDSRVVDNIIRASEILGHFITYNTWSKLIIPVIEDGPHYGHLTVLAGLIKGSPGEYIQEHVEDISKILADDYICCSRKNKYQLELAKCVIALSEKHENKTENTTGYNLFKITVTLIALRAADVEEETLFKLFDNLKLSLGLGNSTGIWKLYVGDLLKHVNVNPKIWVSVTDAACIFLTILAHSGEAFGMNLDIIVDILTELLDKEADAEVRLKTFYVLSDAFEKKEVILKDSNNITEFLEKLIKNVMVPSLVWRPGSTAEAIRTMAASCLKHTLMISPGVNLFSSDAPLQELKEQILPLLISLLEDASYRSRQIAIECLLLLKENCCNRGIWFVEDLVKVYQEILKRLDDPTEKVRLCALQKMSTLFEKCPLEFTQNHYKAHHELIIDTLLTHFDDDDVDVQQMVLEVLKTLSEINRRELLIKIGKHKPLLRNQKGCDDILDFLNDGNKAVE